MHHWFHLIGWIGRKSFILEKNYSADNRYNYKGADSCGLFSFSQEFRLVLQLFCGERKKCLCQKKVLIVKKEKKVPVLKKIKRMPIEKWS